MTVTVLYIIQYLYISPSLSVENSREKELQWMIIN